MQGWTHPALAQLHGIWVIWSDEQTAFVPLEKASAELVAACLGAGGDKSKADQIITNFSVGEKVWLYIGSVFQEHNIRYIHIQKGEWGNTYVRYEMELVSGWYPARAIYRTKEAAMADNR